MSALTVRLPTTRAIEKWALPAILICLFWQIWGDVAGITLRLEDVLIALWLGSRTFAIPLTLHVRYYAARLNRPLLTVCLTLLISIIVTQISPYSGTVQKDALINGGRLILALSVFWLIYHHGKIDTIIPLIIRFSFITTSVALLQIAFWANVLPFSLPSILTSIQPDASDGFGKEIFALYVGNTGTHLWSAMMVGQAIVVWVTARNSSQWHTKWLGIGYVGLLFLILIRMSVRNSIIGLFVTLVGLELVTAQIGRTRLKAILQAITVIAFAVITLVLLFTMAPDAPFLDRVRQVIPQYEYGQITISRASSIVGRIEASQIGWQLFLENPIFGHGFWSFETLQAQVPKLHQYAHAHNIIFQILSEMGLMGALAWGWLITALGQWLWQTRQLVSISAENRIFWQINSAYFIFILFTGMFAIPLWQPAQLTLWMVFVGAWAVITRQTS